MIGYGSIKESEKLERAMNGYEHELDQRSHISIPPPPPAPEYNTTASPLEPLCVSPHPRVNDLVNGLYNCLEFLSALNSNLAEVNRRINGTEVEIVPAIDLSSESLEEALKRLVFQFDNELIRTQKELRKLNEFV